MAQQHAAEPHTAVPTTAWRPPGSRLAPTSRGAEPRQDRTTSVPPPPTRASTGWPAPRGQPSASPERALVDPLAAAQLQAPPPPPRWRPPPAAAPPTQCLWQAQALLGAQPRAQAAPVPIRAVRRPARLWTRAAWPHAAVPPTHAPAAAAAAPPSPLDDGGDAADHVAAARHRSQPQQPPPSSELRALLLVRFQHQQQLEHRPATTSPAQG